MAKAKCVHPTRPLKDACADCPRRKGKNAMAAAEEQTISLKDLQVRVQYTVDVQR
jgi:hypothetical protein